MIDLHSHVLPGIDDGPPTMEGSLALARAAAEQGTTVLAATPHVTWDLPRNTAGLIAGLVGEVNAEIGAAGIGLQVVPGGEIAMSRAADLPAEEVTGLRLGGGPWVLVECPFTPSAAGFDEILHAVSLRGHRILLAHPERSPAFQRDPELLARFVHMGMLAQVTAGSFTGEFGRTVQRTAQDMLARGLVHVVASDAHDAVRRGPAIAAPLREAGIAEERIAWLTRGVPEAILAGDRIPPAPVVEPPPRKGLLSRLRR
jgi:protein-tyrosine phosphatase